MLEKSMSNSSLFQKCLLLAVTLIVAGGCVHQSMDYSIASWQNKPVTAVIDSWGRPSEELRVNGRHLLLWNTSIDTSDPVAGSAAVRPKAAGVRPSWA